MFSDPILTYILKHQVGLCSRGDRYKVRCVYLSLRWRKLLLSSGCSSSKLRLDQLPRLSSPTLSCWDTVDSVVSLPEALNTKKPKERERKKSLNNNANSHMSTHVYGLAID